MNNSSTNIRDSNSLGTAPVGKLLFKLALPSIAAQIVNMLYNIVDRIYIGHMPGNGGLALTGLGVCFPIILIVTAFASLAGMGGAPRASIFMGKGDLKSAEKTLGNCFVMQLIVSVLLTAALLIWDRPILFAFGASENTIEYAKSYMDIYAMGTLFVQLTLGMNAFITAQGFATTGMLTVVVGALCNIVLDPLFIFGFGMGVKGAAIATVISQALSTVWVLAFLRGKKTQLKLSVQNMGLDPHIVGPSIALGLAPFVMTSSESIISLCFNSSLLRYGGDLAVGAMSILTSTMQFGIMPLQGLGQGAQPIMSFNYGAGNAARMKETFLLLLKSSLIYSFTMWAAVMLFPGGFARVFTSDAALAAFTAKALRVYCMVLCLFGIQIACQMTFVAIGYARSSVIVAVMRKFILLLPLIFIMPAVFGADKTMAVYWAEPVADFLAVSFTAALFSVQFRKVLRGLEAGAAPDAAAGAARDTERSR